MTDAARDDLALAAACADGDADAIGVLEAKYLSALAPVLRSQRFDEHVIEETLQAMRASLLADGRIRDYAGRGPLRGWLRAVATNLALKQVKSARKSVLLAEAVASSTRRDPELDLLKARYGPVFRDALRDAFAALEVQERLLLKQRFALGATVTELGVQHGVNASTISRWVAAARGRLRGLVETRIAERLGLDATELRELARLVESQLELSLTTMGREGRETPTGS